MEPDVVIYNTLIEVCDLNKLDSESCVSLRGLMFLSVPLVGLEVRQRKYFNIFYVNILCSLKAVYFVQCLV